MNANEYMTRKRTQVSTKPQTHARVLARLHSHRNWKMGYASIWAPKLASLVLPSLELSGTIFSLEHHS
jgi:hypothetical protein